MKNLAALSVFFILFPIFSHAQDCCGPSGGGGITDKSKTNFTPRLEYSGSFGSFDVYGGAFYTVFLDAPHSHQIDLAENLAWRITPTEHTRLVFRLDNADLFVFFPEDSGLKYASVDPSVAYSAALGFGDLSFSFGLPVVVTPETGKSGAWFCADYEHPIGLGVSLCPWFSLLPDAAYSGATLTLTFAWDRFYVKAAFLANADFTDFQIRPYAECTLKHIVLWAGLGAGDFSASPFVGAGYTF
jgi:hypothetical protein